MFTTMIFWRDNDGNDHHVGGWGYGKTANKSIDDAISMLACPSLRPNIGGTYVLRLYEGNGNTKLTNPTKRDECLTTHGQTPYEAAEIAKTMQAKAVKGGGR